MKNISHIGLICLIGLIFICLKPLAFAQTKPKNTLTVLPQLTQLDLSTDKPETDIYYTNNASFPIELGLSVEDVRELEDRNPVGILDPKEAANYKYSLSSWVTLSTQTLIINPGETKSVHVTINKEKLSPGGHYGTVLAEIKQNSQNKNVNIKGVLASLLFVRASSGNEIEEAKIPFFGLSQSSFTFPDKMFFRFQNTGNVDLTPYGILEVKNSSGQTVAKGIVNEDSLITLPEAIRKYDVSVKPTQGLILPGKYTAILSLHFGKSNKKIVKTSNFITGGSANAQQLGIGILAVLVFLFGLNRLLRKRLNPKP